MLLQWKIPQPPDLITAYLCDPVKFVQVHPVITKMELISAGRYRVFETLKTGPFSFSFRYRATLFITPGTIRINTIIFGLTRVNIIFNISGDARSSTIDEEVLVSSYLPVHGTIKRIFRKQHTALFRNIENALKSKDSIGTVHTTVNC
jgi:hypothetical protein